ncbi:MAG: response regulator transcription factor [Kiritimatiellae bacterium]|nr:response regulator transcription factor [Kiritimatiellia bacterium]
MNGKHILVVEDEPDMVAGLRKILEAEGFRMTAARNGPDGLRCAREAQPDLIVLDVMLPGMDGFHVIRELRAAKSRVPVLMLTAKSQETDKVLGLELGADDYLTKPFGIPELLARIRALLRRANDRVERLETAQFRDFEADFLRQSVRGKRGVEALSTHENAILRLLIAWRGEPVSRNKILDVVWGAEPAAGRTVDFHITNIRKKLAAVTGKREPRLVLTVHACGYKFVG